jgi:hypothetical protein
MPHSCTGRKKLRMWAVGCVKRKKWWDAIWALLGQRRRKDWQEKEKAQDAIPVVFNLQIRISAPSPFQKLMQSSWGAPGGL